MRINSCRNYISSIALVVFTLTIPAFLFALDKNFAASGNSAKTEPKPAPEVKKGTTVKFNWWQEENLSVLQKQSRQYRNQGLELQNQGNPDTALVLYQKAIELDPAYPIVYNDIGILYESKGMIDRAEESYLKAVKLDSNYLSAYTNLALLYENKRNLDKAAFYWRKRAELGAPDDPWTEKAKQRLEDIRLVLSDRPLEDTREQEVLGFIKDVASQKTTIREDDKELAKSYFKQAKQRYAKGEEIAALKIAIDAKQMDPTNAEIEKFIDKVQSRILSQ